MVRRDPHVRWMHPLAPVAVVVGAGAVLFAFAGASGAAVGTVAGGAYGEFVDITISGIGRQTDGPTPSVTLPPAGGSDGQAVSGSSVGPAGLFLTSGTLNATTEGSTGENGAVASAASVANPNVLQTLEATSVASGCSARESGTMGTTTITDGTLLQSADTTIPLPTNPTPNQTFEGTNEDTGDRFRVILNQQETSDGVLTVNAVNFVLLGPTATGNVILAQSRCGVSASAATTTTTSGGTTSTAGPATTRPPTRTGDDLARTGPGPVLVPAVGAGLAVAAVAASRWTRRRSGRPDTQ